MEPCTHLEQHVVLGLEADVQGPTCLNMMAGGIAETLHFPGGQVAAVMVLNDLIDCDQAAQSFAMIACSLTQSGIILVQQACGKHQEAVGLRGMELQLSIIIGPHHVWCDPLHSGPCPAMFCLPVVPMPQLRPKGHNTKVNPVARWSFDIPSIGLK